MTYLRSVAITGDVSTTFSDNGQTDAFGRLKVASPTTLFDAQFTYDLQPLVYEQIKISAGAAALITHDATNRRAKIEFSGAASGDSSYMQTYEYFRYQPGKSQEINITFNMGANAANTTKFARYGDNTNAIGFYQAPDGTLSFRILSGTGVGNQTATQSTWNIDKLDGTGTSGKTLDISTDQILYMDLQALYVGRVRFGFVIDGILYLCHEFDNANAFNFPYIQYANLPISVGMTATGTATATMYFNCCMVASNGGIDEAVGYEFTTPDSTVTAANGSRTHLVSIRPKTTFNGITNRSKLASLELDLIVTGNNPIYWELCIGQANTAATFSDINATYSAFQYASGSNFSPTGSPAIVVDSGYANATASNKGGTSMKLTERYPITLNAAGAVRDLGTLTLFVTGVGASSVCRAVLKHKEIR